MNSAWRKFNFQCNFVAHERLGVVLCKFDLNFMILTIFRNYCMKPSGALDSIRINVNSVWRKFNFQWTFQQLWTCKRTNLNQCFKKFITFNALDGLEFVKLLKYLTFGCNFVAHARLGMVLWMHILTVWFLPSFAHYFKTFQQFSTA